MPKFKVQIEERLCREFEVEAPDAEAAQEKAEFMWYDAQILLDASDFTGASISVNDSAWHDFV